MRQHRTSRWSRWIKGLACLLVVGMLIYGGLLALVVTGSRDEIRGQPQTMIILGCQVTSNGPSVLLQDRLDEALDYLQQHPNLTVVVSGGQGSNEPTSEAQAMSDYLVQAGVSQQQILLEDQSKNTMENLEKSRALLEQKGLDSDRDVVVVSNGFHLTRVRMLWERVGGDPEGLSTLAAPSSHAGAKVAMYMRECLALVKSFLLDR